jgi:hypothetical protein
MACNVEAAQPGVCFDEGGAPLLLQFKLASGKLHGALTVLLVPMAELGRRWLGIMLEGGLTIGFYL